MKETTLGYTCMMSEALSVADLQAPIPAPGENQFQKDLFHTYEVKYYMSKIIVMDDHGIGRRFFI